MKLTDAQTIAALLPGAKCEEYPTSPGRGFVVWPTKNRDVAIIDDEHVSIHTRRGNALSLNFSVRTQSAYAQDNVARTCSGKGSFDDE